MNRIMLIGNLAADPELRITQSGIACCTFRLAVQRRHANADGTREADFLPIVTWRQTAEACKKYLAKGRKAAVEGSVQIRSYTAQDGTKRTITEVIADNVEFLTPQQQWQQDSSSAARVAAPPTLSSDFSENNGFQAVSDDDLPF